MFSRSGKRAVSVLAMAGARSLRRGGACAEVKIVEGGRRGNSLMMRRRGVRGIHSSSHSPTLPEFSLAGKTCVVTGGARGLGKEFLTAFALSGARGVCVDIDLAGGESSIKDIQKEVADTRGGGEGGEVAKEVPELRAYACDVTSEEHVKITWERIVREMGRVDVLVTAAGVVSNMKAEEYEFGNWRRTVDINLNGTFLFAKEAGKYMITEKIKGSIIMISSMSAFIVNRPQPQCAYNASKAAVSHLMKSMAAEWAPYGIRVNALCPGYQMTPLLKNLLEREGDALAKDWIRDTPMGRLGDPKELRGPIVFMASEASGFMTGHNLIVDGGFTAW